MRFSNISSKNLLVGFRYYDRILIIQLDQFSPNINDS